MTGVTAQPRGGAAEPRGGAAEPLGGDPPPIADPDPAPNGYRGLLTLSRREVLRVWKLWTQTVLAPVVSAVLFIVVFGLSLGGRIRHISGVEYEMFIVPGLISMAALQAAYNNTSASVFQARSDRYINDVLAAPMHPWQVNLGFTIGGLTRALAITLMLIAVAVPLTGVPVAHPLVLALAGTLGLIAFSALGTVVGIYAETFDRHTFVSNIVILPLVFLGGVFYSVEMLPPLWEGVSHLNPLFYLVNAIRYGFLGTSDVDVRLCLAVTAALAVPMYAWAQWLFSTGRRLKA